MPVAGRALDRETPSKQETDQLAGGERRERVEDGGNKPIKGGEGGVTIGKDTRWREFGRRRRARKERG